MSEKVLYFQCFSELSFYAVWSFVTLFYTFCSPNVPQILNEQAIAAGKYGRELQNRMRSPDSVYLSRSGEYAYCPHCDEIHFGGRIAVYIHKKGKRAELEYDDWTDSYHLSGFNSEASYERVLQIPTPCWKCGSSLVYFDRYENMKCPRCGSSMKYGSSRRHR